MKFVIYIPIIFPLSMSVCVYREIAEGIIEVETGRRRSARWWYACMRVCVGLERVEIGRPGRTLCVCESIKVWVCVSSGECV